MVARSFAQGHWVLACLWIALALFGARPALDAAPDGGDAGPEDTGARLEAPQDTWSCGAWEVLLIPTEEGLSLAVSGTDFVLRAIPVEGRLRRRPVLDLVVSSDGTVFGARKGLVGAGDRLMLRYADGTGEQSCVLTR